MNLMEAIELIKEGQRDEVLAQIKQGRGLYIAKKLIKAEEAVRWPEFIADLGYSVTKANLLINLYTDHDSFRADDGEEVHIEPTLPKTAAHHRQLKGADAQERAVNYQNVRKALDKDKPTVNDIKEYNEIGGKVEDKIDYKELYARETAINLALEEENARLKADLKKAKATIKALKNRVSYSATFLAAEERLAKFWESLHACQESYMRNLRKQHKRPYFISGTSLTADLAVLGFTFVPTKQQVKDKYKELAKSLHPDMPQGNEEAFKKLLDSYNNLKILLKG